MSEQFIVSARKYRPQRFDEVVGQGSTTTTLKNAIQNKQLAHSFLFCGPRGVGKTTIARILAKTINCKDLQADGEACDRCDSCTSFNKNASFNIVELDAASKNGVEHIKEIIEQVHYSPQNAEYKVFIIDEVHMLTTAAFNAFLKTLEEPPSYAKFILATTEKHKVLPTILSRCQIYDFNRIKVADIQSHLEKISKTESINAEETALNMIAQKADGGLRDALSMFDRLASIHGNKILYADVLHNLNILDHDYYFQLLDYVIREENDRILLLLDEIIGKGFELDTFLSGLSEHIRNLWVSRKDQTMLLLEVSEEIKHKYVKQASNIDEPTMLNILQVVADCEVQLKQARNRRLLVELALLKLCYVKHVVSASWLDADQKKKLTRPNNPTKDIQSSPIDISNGSNSQTSAINSPKAPSVEDIIQQATALASQKAKEANQPAIISEIPLYSIAYWNRMVEQYSGMQHQMDKVRSVIPTIEDTSYIVYVSNGIEQGMWKNLIVELHKISRQYSTELPIIECVIDASLTHVEDLNLKTQFLALNEKYPILDRIRDEFKLIF
jgi:DNA polymerase III subunit gamma/tau